MMDYLLGALGIVVSVVLFLFGYRQTEGARRARLAAANVDLERILVRRIAIDKYIPKEVDLIRLTEGKARDHRVRIADVLSTEQLLNAAYTRIVESDLIPSGQREDILSRITPVLMQAEVQPMPEDVVEELATDAHSARWRAMASAVMAVTAASIGTLTVAIPELSTLSEIFETPELLVTALASLLVIGWVYLLMRIRIRQEEKSKPHKLSKYIALEAQVHKLLKDFGTITMPLGGYPDFLMTYKGRTFAIEVKAWPARLPRSVLLSTAERLRQAAEQADATEAIIIALESPPTVRDVAESKGVKVFTVKELKSYLTDYTK